MSNQVKYIETIEDKTNIFINNEILEKAVDEGASDIHIEPKENHISVKFRIDGDLWEFIKIHIYYSSQLINAIKLDSGMNIDIKHLPQDGAGVYKTSNKKIDLRISSLPTYYGEKIVIRLLSRNIALDFDSLNFLKNNKYRLINTLNNLQGLILVSGATGSGKTTTLYTLLNQLIEKNINISTLEDPIEYKFPQITQTEIDEKKGLTFSKGLETLLRQDPDVILIGEVRDQQTAKLALEASMTGHLVLGTIHSNPGLGIVERLVKLGIDPYMIASTLKLTIYQKLLKGVCPNCNKKRNPTDEELNEFKNNFNHIILSDQEKFGDKLCKNLVINEGQGCEQCFYTGLRGRTAIHEVITVDKDFYQAINNLSLIEWNEVIKQKHNYNIYQDALIKVFMGQLDIKQALLLKNIV